MSVLRLGPTSIATLFSTVHDGIKFNFFVEQLEDHPFLAIGKYKGEKQVGQHLPDGSIIHHDHLSLADYAFRTTRNFTLHCGYTNSGDGTPIKRIQMSHL